MHGIELGLDESIETLLAVKEKLWSIKDKNLRTSLILLHDIAFHCVHVHLSENDRLAHVENIKANIKMLNHWHYLSTNRGKDEGRKTDSIL